MKLRVGYLYQVRPGELLPVSDPTTRERTNLVVGSTLLGGDLFIVLEGPWIKRRKTPYKDLHSYIIIHEERILLIDEILEESIKWYVGFHTP